MSLKAILYAYILGGITFVPLVLAGVVFLTIYTSVPVGDSDSAKPAKRSVKLEAPDSGDDDVQKPSPETNDLPKTKKGWLIVRRTFEEPSLDASYVTFVRSFLDARSKDPKRSRPKDMWYVVLKGKVLYLYEDEGMIECEAVIELGGHDVVVYPEGLLDGELFTKRNAICLRPKPQPSEKAFPSLVNEMKLQQEDGDAKVEQHGGSVRRREKERDRLLDAEKTKDNTRDETFNQTLPWFIFVRSCVDMEDWYMSLVHASDHPSKTPTLTPLQPIFQPSDMNYLVATLDEQPDVIPMRWFNALIGRIFFSYYRTHTLEDYIIGRLMKKLSKVKRPTFLSDVVVKEVSVGDKAPTFSKPMLKELTKEGDASMEVHLRYKGEFRITIEATATINIGARFKPYNVKLVLAAVLKELEGNLLIKVKRPPSNRIWYAFTATPRMVLAVEPVVSDRQITWSMILSPIETRLKEIIQESIVLPNMDDVAFFESSRYIHRGGIWQDASRHERRPPSLPEREKEKEEGDTQSSVSLPVSEDQDASIAPGLSTPQRSQSVQDPSSDVSCTVSAPVGIPPSLTTEAQSHLPATRTHNRRSSWFSSVRSEHIPSLTKSDTASIDDSDDSDAHRGRSTSTDRHPIGVPRSHSTPLEQDMVDDDSEQGNRHNTMHLAPTVSRRSSSQHSSASARVHSKSISSESGSSISEPIGPSKTTSTPSSPNSFLSALKSRAGDKQALSNTAKEAMRKWGVWSNLRKDSSNATTNSDDVSDHMSIGSSIGARLKPEANSVLNKARASYAEVRAAVAERRGRDRNSNSHTDARDRQHPSNPIPFPESSGQDKLAVNPSSSPYQEARIRSISSGSSASGPTPAGSATPPASHSTNASPIVSHTNANQEFVMDDASQEHIPIHVQPQAKTMTIPGIHASHRGEVMSLGYVAPQPEGKSSIQSVYRLLKNPLSAGNDQGQGKKLSELPASAEDQVSHNSSTSPLHSPSRSQGSQSPPSRPVPPPLPPRSTPVAISRSAPESSSGPSNGDGSTSASEALRSIATKDDRTRRSLENGDYPLSTESRPDVDGSADHGLAASDQSLSLASTVTKSIPNPGPPLPPRRTVQA